MTDRDDRFDLSRRTFLQLCGAAGIVAAVPSAALLVPDPEVVEAARSAGLPVSGDFWAKIGGVWKRLGTVISAESWQEVIDAPSIEHPWIRSFKAGPMEASFSLGDVRPELYSMITENGEPMDIRIHMADHVFIMPAALFVGGEINSFFNDRDLEAKLRFYGGGPVQVEIVEGVGEA